ncbi:MAG TPA: lmo0937 family membrane protein [Candidatus Didemnitutus sp.]|nr:lmo0937 family membrane protein [Candidatus Didemnitutus sp.]
MMLETLAISLVLLWLLGVVTACTLGGFIHVLLGLAFLAIVIRVMRDNKPVT